MAGEGSLPVLVEEGPVVAAADVTLEDVDEDGERNSGNPMAGPWDGNVNGPPLLSHRPATASICSCALDAQRWRGRGGPPASCEEELMGPLVSLSDGEVPSS